MRLALLLPLALLSFPAWSQAPGVVSVSPATETVGAVGDELVVTFDGPLDPATVTAASFRVFGHWSGPRSGSRTLEAGNTVVRFTPDAPFQAGDRVVVQLSRAITGSDGTPLAHGYAWAFWTAAAPSSLLFDEVDRLSTRLPGESPIVSYGAYGGDLDGDGFSDLAVINEIVSDVRVFLNDSAGRYEAFTVHPLPDASIASSNEGADFDGDGHLDLVVGSTQSATISVLLGDGAGGFSSVASFVALSGNNRGVAVGDFDGDGYDDIVTSSGSTDVLSLFRGRGDGTFDPAEGITVEGDNQLALATADANADGILDLFVGDFNGRGRLLLGDGDGGFTTTATSVQSPGGAWMAAAGDLNGDGFADVAFASSFANGVQVYYSDGTGGFADEAFIPAGQFGLAMDLGDLDGDGDLDGVISSGESDDFVVLENVDGELVPGQSLPAVDAGSCATLHDRDNDGDLDITGIDELADLIFLFESRKPNTAEPSTGPAGVELAVAANPFRERAVLEVRLDRPRAVRLRIVDVRGREVAALLGGELGSGRHAVTWDARGLPAGVYVARLTAGPHTLSRTLTRLP